jgi:hypothetical protein
MLAKQNTGGNAANCFQGANGEYQDPKDYQDPGRDIPAGMPKRNRNKVAEVVIPHADLGNPLKRARVPSIEIPTATGSKHLEIPQAPANNSVEIPQASANNSVEIPQAAENNAQRRRKGTQPQIPQAGYESESEKEVDPAPAAEDAANETFHGDEDSGTATYSKRRQPSRRRNPSEPASESGKSTRMDSELDFLQWEVDSVQFSIDSDFEDLKSSESESFESDNCSESDDSENLMESIQEYHTAAEDNASDSDSDEESAAEENGESSATNFEYSKPARLSAQEIMSIALYQIKSHRNISQEAHHDYASIVSLVMQERMLDLRTVEALMERTTGIAHIRYDVCKNGCVCFSPKYSDATTCPLCGIPRLTTKGKPWKTFDYIPIQHRLRLQYANERRAREFTEYRQALDLDAEQRLEDGDDSALRDFWDGKLCKELKARGMLTLSTDLAFALSTDGVELFRKGKKHQVWPLVLTCYNISPTLRFLEDNIFCLGIIPGPKKPADLDSFLHPVIAEFKSLHKGVDTFCVLGDGDRILLRAYIVAVTADMPARDSLMGLAGYNSRHYCNYCNIRGCSGASEGSHPGKHMYCPLVPPKDVPTRPDWKTYESDALPYRDSSKDRKVASKLACSNREEESMSATMRKATTNSTGIKSFTVLWELPSIIWPWSFPLDNMHLFFLNIASHMRDHWRGHFFPWERALAGSAKSATNKFKDSKEEYCLSPKTWEELNNELNNIIFPTAFGDAMRGVYEMRTANEYKTWIKLVSPIVLKDRLPEPFYSEWLGLVEAITIATDYSVTPDDIAQVRVQMERFVLHYHDSYYRYEQRRLSACKPVFHALLHVADCLEWLGPMWSYAQWCIERMFALWTPKVCS